MTTAIIPTREQLCDFIYYRHKDAYGVKGRMFDFDSMSYDELEAMAIRIDGAANEQIAHERRCDAEALIEFRARIRLVRAMCGVDRSTAIRYILEGEGYMGEYDPSYICYCMGLPYSAAKYIEPRLNELNDRAPEEEFVEAYDDLEVA
jgi:hypothetical protein